MDGPQDCDTVLTAKRSNLNIPRQYMSEGPCVPVIFQVRQGSMWHSAGVSADPAVPPSGVVTFLFTDVEGSTRRWEADAEAMRAALAAHDEVLRAAIQEHGGWLFKHTPATG